MQAEFALHVGMSGEEIEVFCVMIHGGLIFLYC